jgi:hypothetical protein
MDDLSHRTHTCAPPTHQDLQAAAVTPLPSPHTPSASSAARRATAHSDSFSAPSKEVSGATHAREATACVRAPSGR